MLTALETRFEPRVKIRRWLDRREIPEQEQCATDLCILLRTVLTFYQVSLHANELDTGEGIVYEGKMLITKLATIHVDRLRVR